MRECMAKSHEVLRLEERPHGPKKLRGAFLPLKRRALQKAKDGTVQD